jgi:hypothetical protein
MIRGFLPILICSMLITFSLNSFATKFVAKGNGNWSDSGVWDKGTVPTLTDTVYIDGYNITIDVNLKIKSIYISNLSDINSTSLNIIDTLIVMDDFVVSSENKTKNIDVTVNENGLLRVYGNMNFTRTENNTTANRLQFYMNNNAKAYILGNLTYNYKNASALESSIEIYITGSAILDITGQTSLNNINGKGLNFLLEGNSQVILRDSLSLLLHGGEETAITADQNSHFQLLSSAYLLNAGGTNHTKLKSGDTGGKMTITGNVYLESTVDKMAIKLEANGTDAELNIIGDIIMTSTSDESNLIHLSNKGKLNLGGDILRPTNFGALKMEAEGMLVFNGTEPQAMPIGKISGSGNDSLFFGIVSIENTSSSTFELTSDLIIKDSLILSSGKIKTSNSSILIIEDGAFIKGGDADSYIEGPIIKKGATINVPFTFPVGDEKNYAPMTITPESTLNSAEYKVQYYSDPPPFGVIYLNNISGSEYWEMTKSAGTPDADITLSWYDADAQGIQDLNDLVVAGLLGGDWVSYGNGGTTGTTGSNGSGTIINNLASDPPPFGVIYFTLGSTTGLNALPVELNSFQAIQQDSHAFLHWETASERNTSHFSIERSTNGVDFKEIGIVQGRGDATFARQYSFKDITPENGVNYYRLKIIDHDYTFEYSNIEVIIFEAAPVIKLFPNPVEKTIQLEGLNSNLGNVLLEIFDRNGKLIFSNKISINDGRLQISTETVNIQNPGTYFLRVIGQGQSHVLKFIKIN